MCNLSVRVVVFVFLFFVIPLSDQRSIAPDNKKLYHDIVSGLGLYNNFKQIVDLSPDNFKDSVFNHENPKMWVVEFYNSWCGHCHRFAPIFKNLAVDIYNWREVIGIGAVDCANDKNNQLCRDYEIMAYPSLKVFPLNSPDTFLGGTFAKGTVDEMKFNIIRALENEQYAGQVRENLNLKPFNDSNLNVLWFNIPYNVQHLFLLVQDDESPTFLGTEVALDFVSVKNIHIRTAYTSNKGLLLSLPTKAVPSVFAIERNNHVQLLSLEGGTLDDVERAIINYLKDNGIHVRLSEKKAVNNVDFDIADAMKMMEIHEEIKKKLDKKDLSDVVFQVDLEGALQYSLYHEIGNKKLIEGEQLDALKKYLTVLSKHFPIGTEGRKFLVHLKNDVDSRNVVHGQNFTLIAKHIENETSSAFLPKQNWIGCQGSQPQFRGYPCSLWTMFHTLTVQAENKKDAYPGADPKEVLEAMVGYVKNFFGCTDCSEHFQAMAVTMAGNVSTVEDSVLWLWNAHNQANKRLTGDITEDPEHIKVQFPSQQSCPLCRNGDGEWNAPQVLDFLKGMYLNISYIQWSDLPAPQPVSTEKPPSETSYSKRLRHENIGDDTGYRTHDNSTAKSTWDFNVFDISLCVVLYTSSVVILLLVCIKFVVRKGYKKKPYSYDFTHGKV